MPRNRNVSDPTGLYLGDYVDVKLAYLEYTVPTDRADIRIYVGKIDSTLGIEYRSQESPDRITVTPSLICRYTCGRPTGVKARARFFGDLFDVALAVTNGSNVTEQFPFSDEIDTNNFKTVSGRLSSKLPVGAGLEVGVSGAFGAQDFQVSDSVYQWHVGGDLHLEIRDFDLRGEVVSGSADGQNQGTGMLLVQCGTAPCLHYKGAYGQVAYRVLNWLMPYARVDWRSAFHRERRQLRLHHGSHARDRRAARRARHQRHPQGRVHLRARARAHPAVPRRRVHQLPGGQAMTRAALALVAACAARVPGAGDGGGARRQRSPARSRSSARDCSARRTRRTARAWSSTSRTCPARRRRARWRTQKLAQRDKQFVPRVVAVMKGAAVEFPNEDKMFHNVFSLSQPAKFDLGLYKSGTSKTVTFDRAGAVDIYCNIHPEMTATIKVVDGGWFAVTGADGSFRLDGVPPGTYRSSAGSRAAPSTAAASRSRRARPRRSQLEVIEAGGTPRHLRKDGTPYGRYE